MIELLARAECLPFLIALLVMFGISLLEGVASLVGLGVSQTLDSLLPDVDFDADADGLHSSGPQSLSRVLGWLRIGQVPALMLLIILLTAFGLYGLGVQWLANTVLGAPLPAVVAIILAFLAALPTLRVCGGVLAKIIPKDETDAVAEESFIGRVATIVLGTAAKDSPAQAKLTDVHGNTHYVMVVPDVAEETFSSGEHVLLVARTGSHFKVIANPHTLLVDEE